MKICFVSPKFPTEQYPDGVWDYTQKVCEEMARLGHDITILMSSGYGADFQSPLKTVPFAPAWGFKTFLRLFKLCRMEKYDILNLQYSPPFYGVFFKIFYPFIRLVCPAVMTIHTLVGAGSLNRLLAFMLITFSSGVISTNEEVSYMIGRYMPWKKDFARIPIGSNIIPPEKEKIEAKEEKDVIVLTHFGLFYPGKGVETILRAVAELKKEYKDFKLVMIGGKWPGKEQYYESLRQQAKQLDVDDKVSWVGYLPSSDVSEYLSKTDIYLIPYDMGISIRRGSYMAGLVHGLPMISTYAKIKSEYIREGENIALVPPRDPVALKNKILELIHDPDKRTRLAENARSLVDEFSWPKIASRMIQVFEKVRERGA
ncbi:MAG: glycosyltransferase family 4 protein [Candidatus Omnitrophota bacterium]